MTNNYGNQSTHFNTATVVVDDDDGPNTFVDKRMMKLDDDIKDEQKLNPS